jgi:hypothetical protein
MKTFAIVTFCFLLIMPAQKQKPAQLELGAEVKQEFIQEKKTKELYMTHPSQLRPFIRQEIDGVGYVIAYDEESRKVKYITTNDKDFTTDEGLRVGNFIELTKDEIIAYPGWEIRGPANKDGWHPVVGFLDKVTIMKEAKRVTTDIEQIWKLDPSDRFQVMVIGFSKGGN